MVGGTRLRAWVLQAHLWTALGFGLALCVVTVSGSSVVFKQPLERMLYADRNRLATRGSEPPPSWEQVAALAHARHPDGSISYLIAPAASAGIIAILMDGAHDESWWVFSDPATGMVIGDTRGKAIAATLEWLVTLHTSLFLGEMGPWIIGISSMAGLFLIASGLWLWWPGIRKALRSVMVVRWAHGGMIRHFDLHRMIGFWTLPGLLLACLTGAMFEFSPVDRLIMQALGERQSHAWDLPESARPRSVRPVGVADPRPADLDQLVTAIYSAAPDHELGLFGTRVGEDDESLRIWLAPKDAAQFECSGMLYFDRWSLRLLRKEAGRGNVAAYVGRNAMPLHMGSCLGVPGMIFFTVAGLAPPTLLISGLGIWLHRRRLKAAVAT